MFAICVAFLSGCQLHLNSWDGDSIPANRLDPNLFSCSRESSLPIPQTRLGQPSPSNHRIGAGDVLSIYIHGVFPSGDDETPVLMQQQGLSQRYYPPNGGVVSPATGLPVQIQKGGVIDLPMIGPLVIDGLTMADATEAIRSAYQQQQILLEGQNRITVSLLIPRTFRIVVLREDSSASAPTMASPKVVEHVQRGSGQMIDLPIYENDVLHALTASGGMPGSDAKREIFIIRAQGSRLADTVLESSDPSEIVHQWIDSSQAGSDSIGSVGGASVVRIPLMINDCQNTTFSPSDVLLHEGDVVFVPPRNEYYYTGGLLGGGRVPLPRDEDLDIVEAISMAGASPGGPMGQNGASLANGRHTYLRGATRAIVLRRTPDGRQLNIRVDLDRAMHDPKERLRIEPDDVIMLHQKPVAAVINAALNVGVR